MKTVQEIIKDRDSEKVVRIKEALTGDNQSAIATGFPQLDDLMEGGLRPGDLMILSGRSGMGKTTVGLNLMLNYVKINPVLFTYEMRVDKIYSKLMKMGMGDDPNIYTPKKNVSGDVNWIEDRTLEAIRKFKSKLIIIDHLDFLTAEHKSDEGRRNEITSIVSKLKLIAVDKGLMVVLQAHVRKGESRTSSLSNDDLADSRSIANLADYVMFVNRESDNVDGIATGNEGRLVLTKNRQCGTQGVINYRLTAGDLIIEL